MSVARSDDGSSNVTRKRPIRKPAEGTPSTSSPTPAKLDVKKLPPLADLAKRLGDVERGKEIWAMSFKGETQCAKCHTVEGRGGKIVAGKRGRHEPPRDCRFSKLWIRLARR